MSGAVMSIHGIQTHSNFFLYHRQKTSTFSTATGASENAWLVIWLSENHPTLPWSLLRISASGFNMLLCESLIRCSNHPTSVRLWSPELPTWRKQRPQPKEALTDIEAFCLRIDAVPDQEHQKSITKMSRKIFEDQELKLMTLSNQVQNLQGLHRLSFQLSEIRSGQGLARWQTRLKKGSQRLESVSSGVRFSGCIGDVLGEETFGDRELLFGMHYDIEH